MLGTNPIHANFSVNDLSAARDFYSDKLGFKVIRENDNELVLEGGKGTKINIYPKKDHKPWDSTVLGIEVDDIEKTVEDLKSLGIKIEVFPYTNERGIMSDPDMGEAAWFKDPAGNWVCIEHMTR
jgi:catechol 2,3-dioxygenase-like lactoylglutathione lyase family enzyme